MVKFKPIWIGLLFLIFAAGTLFFTPKHVVSAATLPATATATRVLHVTVKAHNTATPTPPSRTMAQPTAAIGLGGSIEATVEAYITQNSMLLDGQHMSQTLVVSAAQPVRLIIPSLQVNALIERVGRSSDGAMDTPSRVEHVAWYGLGVAPGEVGKAVIAGHFDLADGSPAVFWDIGKLRVGDELIVSTRQGVEYHFQVTKKQRYAYEAAPLEEIFGFSLNSELNLITCTGTWDRDKRNYSNRLVVYTQLVKTVQPTATQ